jgi:excisionase family DNA binding protein
MTVQGASTEPHEGHAAEVLLDPEEVAKMLGVRVRTLQTWRSRRQGPTYVKVGKLVRYKSADVMAYIERHRIDVGQAAPASTP